MAWGGMRGAVSLAVALALPFTTDAGGSFPDRDLVVFLTFAVIFFSLVVQGLSLLALIRRLGVSDSGTDADEEGGARHVVTKAAIEQIDALAGEEWTRDDTVERIHAFTEYRNSTGWQTPSSRSFRGRGPLARLPADAAVRAVGAARGAVADAKRRAALERGDEPEHAPARPRGVAAGNLSHGAGGGELKSSLHARPRRVTPRPGRRVAWRHGLRVAHPRRRSGSWRRRR